MIEGDSSAADLIEDRVGGRGPHERLGIIVIGRQVGVDRGDQVLHGLKIPRRIALIALPALPQIDLLRAIGCDEVPWTQ